MNAAERRKFRQVKVLIRAGDRAAALAVLETLSYSSHREPEAEQLMFRVVEFHCDRLHMSMTVEDCVQRRGATWPSGRRKGAPKCLHCQDCETGRALAFACPGIELRRPSQAPEVLPEQQRRAKRAKALVVLEPGETWSLDPLTEASQMTPTDESDYRG